uniref:Long-chain acyl-CoA synthetase n=1 Tax=Candidatus Kentrum sp. UNK TaxID=2126344 RepID=A0A451B4X7_9GAMM|nr:MAG: long-chain acyl-CoA synthetase [Candidatus Kentron sp. UNK]VFK73331.1 MAG: long-chain acyl-CoA synthetase [Candidatus Kentron sp. UNK]
MNLLDVFLETAARQPDRPLLHSPRAQYTYTEFRQFIADLIDTLKQQGIRAGDCIALHYSNSPEYIALVYAIWGCNACVVPIPLELTAEEKQAIFHTIHIDALLSRADLIADLEAVQAGESVTFNEHIVFFRCRWFCAHPAGFADVNVAFVRFTSGTTGDSKGVVLSHETVFERIHAANQALHLGPDDRVVWLLSMAYHFTVSIVAYLSFGCAIVLPLNSFGISIIRAAVQYRATLMYAAPMHYNLMAQDRSKQMLPNTLRLAIVTTTALSHEVATAFYRRFNKPLNETYGIIEVGLPCMNLEKPLEKAGSIGKVLPAYEVRLRDQGPLGGSGEIQVRGKGMFDAYYSPWRTYQMILKENDGWFSTGDIGEFDAQDYLFIRGRGKDIISVGGLKFFPQEVEAVLESHPAIESACVFRTPDPRLGDIPHAALIAGPNVAKPPTLKDIIAFCIQHLAVHKIPVQVTFVKHLKKTASGKLIRNVSQLTN